MQINKEIRFLTSSLDSQDMAKFRFLKHPCMCVCICAHEHTYTHPQNYLPFELLFSKKEWPGKHRGRWRYFNFCYNKMYSCYSCFTNCVGVLSVWHLTLSLPWRPPPAKDANDIPWWLTLLRTTLLLPTFLSFSISGYLPKTLVLHSGPNKVSVVLSFRTTWTDSSNQHWIFGMGKEELGPEQDLLSNLFPGPKIVHFGQRK